MTYVKVALLLQTSTVDVRGKVQDTELAACLRPEERVRAENNDCDPLSMFVLVVTG